MNLLLMRLLNQRMMFRPFSFGLPNPFCCSSFMSVPYFPSDNLTFMNEPVSRDTSMDFLLDPRYTMMQCQQKWQQQGGGYDYNPNLSLPSASSDLSLPGSSYLTPPVVQNPKTEKEKEAEKKKEEESKKPEAEKAKSLNDLFKAIKEVCEDEDNLLDPISDELSKKAEEAMKKETAEEQYEAMKEVIEEIDPSLIRKTILNVSVIRENLRKAGYNFNNRKYSLKNPDIKDGNFDNKKKVEELHRDIKEYKMYKYNALQSLAGDVHEGNISRKYILSFVSAWNDAYNTKDDRGILRFVAANLPEPGSLEETTFKAALPICIDSIASALIEKATEYSGNEKIEKMAKNVSDKLAKIMKETTDSEENKVRKDFTQANINALADEFDKLYVELRMQEAVKVRDSINKNDTAKILKDVDPTIIGENIVVDETIKDLQEEGFSDTEIPKVSELTKAKKSPEEREREDFDNKKADKKLKGDSAAKLEYLVDKGYLTKINSDSDVYKTIGLDDEDKDAKYYQIVNNTLVEVYKNDEDEFEPVEEKPKEASVEYIGNYHDSIERAKNLISNNIIADYRDVAPHSKYPIFKATGADEFFIIKDSKLCKIKECTDIQEEIEFAETEPEEEEETEELEEGEEEGEEGKEKVKVKKEATEKYIVKAIGPDKVLEELTTDNFLDPDFKDDAIKSKAKADKEEKDRQNADSNKVTEQRFSNLKEAKSYKKLKELSLLVTDNKAENVFKALSVNGYFSSTYQGKTKFYRYDEKNNKLVLVPETKEIKNALRYKPNGGCVECREIISDEPLGENESPESRIQQYGLKFAKDVSGTNTDEQHKDAIRKMNTLVGMLNKDCGMSDEDKAFFTVHFIKGYQSNTHIYTAQDHGICKQIVEEDESIIKGNDIHSMNSAKRYIAKIAALMLLVAEQSNFGNAEDCEKLQKIANGEFITKTKIVTGFNTTGYSIPIDETTIFSTANVLDEIIDKIIEEYDKKNK